MKLRHVGVLALVALSLGACKKREPAVAPAPSQDSVALAAQERARADSIAAAEAAARAEREAREAAERTRLEAINRARATLEDMVFFAFDSDAIDDASQEKLRIKAAILRANPELQIRIDGHADERGSTEYNLALGQRRAEAVKTFLTGYGIDGVRVATLSYGEERPLEQGTGDEAWARNRRAEVALTQGQIATVPNEVQ